MIYITYNSTDYKFLLKLLDFYQYIEIRQDYCKFSKKQLIELFYKSPQIIFTLKGDFKKIKNQLLFALDNKVGKIDFDIDWGLDNYSFLKNYILNNNLDSEIILSIHKSVNDKFFKDFEKNLIDIQNVSSGHIKIVIENIDEINELEYFNRILNNINSNTTILATGKFGKIARLEALKRNLPLFYIALNEQLKLNNSMFTLEEMLVMNEKAKK